MTIRVAVIEDDAAALAAVSEAVTAADDLRVVGTAATLGDGRALIAAGGLDVALIDLRLGDDDATPLISECRDSGLRALVLSALGDEHSVVAAIAAGAHGYVAKDAPLSQLADAIHQVDAGGAPVSPSVARHLLRTLRDRKTPTPADNDTLSPREREVLRALASGYTYKEVAQRCGISYHTVVDYVRSLYRKLEVHSRTEAVVAGARQGIISIDG